MSLPMPNDPSLLPFGEPEAPRIYRVAELAALITAAIEGRFPDPIFVEGEISNLRRQPSGHMYFSLNDPSGTAKIDAVWFARRQTAVGL